MPAAFKLAQVRTIYSESFGELGLRPPDFKTPHPDPHSDPSLQSFERPRLKLRDSDSPRPRIAHGRLSGVTHPSRREMRNPRPNLPDERAHECAARTWIKTGDEFQFQMGVRAVHFEHRQSIGAISSKSYAREHAKQGATTVLGSFEKRSLDSFSEGVGAKSGLESRFARSA
jgi:hypothetical protein